MECFGNCYADNGSMKESMTFYQWVRYEEVSYVVTSIESFICNPLLLGACMHEVLTL